MKNHKRAISLFMVRLPYEKEQADAKQKIEAILTPNEPDKYVQPYYARNAKLATENNKY